LISGVRGLAASLVPVSDGLPGIAAVAVLAAVVGVCGAALYAGWQGRAHPLAGAAGLAALCAAVLAAWWEPQTHKFWVPALVCGWLAVGLALSGDRAGRGRALASCAAAIALLNLALVVLPRAAGPNPYRAAARQVGAATAPPDLIIAGVDILGPHLAYYAARPHVTNLFAIFLDSRGRDGREALRKLVDHTRARDGRVFVTSDAFEIPPGHRALAPGIPDGFEALLPGAQRVPALRFSVGGSQRVLYQLIEK
jgi:hypothetical protein